MPAGRECPTRRSAHWQLAEWCEENGLKAEAQAHLAAVVRLNPAREEAWKKLGYQRPKGRWTNPELASAIKVESDHQKKADAHWRVVLEKWNSGLARKSKREEVGTAMAKVHDPRAVPSIWKVFVMGASADQERAVRLLAQIDSPAASRRSRRWRLWARPSECEAARQMHFCNAIPASFQRR